MMTTDKDLAQSLSMSEESPAIGDIYEHYKGGLYVVLCRSVDEETLQPLVTYRSNLKGYTWTRTLKNFTATVQLANGNIVNRFRHIKL